MMFICRDIRGEVTVTDGSVREPRTAMAVDKGADPLRIELQSKGLNYSLSMIVYSENIRRKQQR